jgi:hypothetical protein
VSAEAHVAVAQSVLLAFTATLAQIRLAVLEFASPTSTYSVSNAKLLKSTLTACTVTRRSKSTRHHWPVPYAVVEKVALLLSLAKFAGFRKSYTPTITCVVSVLDCVVAHALLRIPPQDRAKLSWYATSSYVGPWYPALHVQFQTDTAPTADALVFTHDVQTVCPVRSAYVFAGQSLHAADPYTDLYLPSTHATQSGPYAPVYPGLQKQAVSAVAPESEYEFTGHVSHR